MQKLAIEMEYGDEKRDIKVTINGHIIPNLKDFELKFCHDKNECKFMAKRYNINKFGFPEKETHDIDMFHFLSSKFQNNETAKTIESMVYWDMENIMMTSYKNCDNFIDEQKV